MTALSQIRLGADIGGTFTDIVLDVRGTIHSTKVLTNYAKPEQAILDEIDTLVGRWASEREAGEAFGDFVIRAGIVRPVLDSARDFYD